MNSSATTTTLAPHHAARRFFALLDEVEDRGLRGELHQAAAEMVNAWIDESVERARSN